MPLELNGFYWDEERKRYFPNSSKPRTVTRPKEPISDSTTTAASQTFASRNRRRASQWDLTNDLRRSSSHAENSRVQHELLSSNIASSSRVMTSRPPVVGKVTAFCSTDLNGQPRRFLGDDRGFLYSCDLHDLEWAPQFNLHPSSQISSICSSGDFCIATCFGGSSKIAVQNLRMPMRTTLLTLNRVHDIWTSHLRDRTLVLGANKQAVLLRDVEASSPVEPLHTNSDVFAIEQKDNLIYTGTRGGSILVFDKRTTARKPHGQRIFEGRVRSSVVHLRCFHDTKILVSHMDGTLCALDLRYPTAREPIMEFRGHVNRLSRTLGCAIDPCEDFLYAAGDDARIRGWSLRMGGEAFWDIPGPGSAEPVVAMQVTEEKRDGTCLWAAGGRVLGRYYLGQTR
ncbi:quinon protein alcohol dehydrogenase-like superfamily [Armillaria luteobubalina]|uniref:Quinon protein alcohol dehydrogenase-like superfamily n=1 Tax=Armillaria luteobubalina TaxID=153913 RepID=A0AA39QJM3_9AGAR|nr:quinon protein alcohol dehydrogenase-like superfamily [Armillaria luteobubalina]